MERFAFFYSTVDFNWWRGRFNQNTLSFGSGPATNTAGFGHIEHSAKFFTGRFGSATQDAVVFYYPSDGDWFIGIFDANGQMTWHRAANTGRPGTGFGDISRDLFFVGDFTGNGQSEILFYSTVDFNWWLGKFNGTTLSFSNGPNGAAVANTSGFGHIEKSAKFFTGRFGNANKDSVVFYHPSDGHWFIGTVNGGVMSWAQAAATGAPGTGFGDISNDLFFAGNFANDGSGDNILFYSTNDFNWWLGQFSGTSLSFGTRPVANTSGFGRIEKSAKFFTGTFADGGMANVLFYHPFDGNWIMGTINNGAISWSLVGGTGS